MENQIAHSTNHNLLWQPIFWDSNSLKGSNLVSLILFLNGFVNDLLAQMCNSFIWIWSLSDLDFIFNLNFMFCFLLLLCRTVYRIYTSVLFHGSLLHVLFNMMALVPLGSELERIMGSVRLSYLIILLATSNALLHLLIALLATYNPFHPFDKLMNECAIGFSGILFSMIVIETSLSGVQSRRWVLLMYKEIFLWYFRHYFSWNEPIYNKECCIFSELMHLQI